MHDASTRSFRLRKQLAMPSRFKRACLTRQDTYSHGLLMGAANDVKSNSLWPHSGGQTVTESNHRSIRTAIAFEERWTIWAFKVRADLRQIVQPTDVILDDNLTHFLKQLSTSRETP
jgi:hypothetical protein